MAMFSGGVPGGWAAMHSDVLNATIPETQDSKISLCDEIKSRAKRAIGTRNFPEAIALYTKAIDVMNNENDQDAYQSILYANRSMCEQNMGNSAKALDDASRAISYDMNYAKAYYRKAVALMSLQKFNEAKESLEAGLEFKPDDKDLQKKMVEVQVGLQKKAAGGTSNIKTTSTTTTTTTTTSKPITIKSAPAPAPVPARASTAKASSELEDDDDEGLGKIRGYKKTSDGRTTTFFNNELDEKTKALIGDIAPQKIDSSVSSNLDSASTATQGSAWNTAGTFESKNMTSMAKERIRAVVKALSVSNKDALLSVKEVTEIEGDAEIVAARGKRKHIYDLSLKLKWQIEGGDDTITGSMTILDIEADDDSEYDLNEVTVDTANAKNKALVDKYIKNTSNGESLTKRIFDSLTDFRREFKKL